MNDDVKCFNVKEIDQNFIEIDSIVGANHSHIDLYNYSLLCTELKQLYTASTRPRNNLIIFDQDIKKREVISQYWKSLNLVNVVKDESLDNNINSENNGNNLV